MIGEVYTEDGIKKVREISGAIPTGNPVGSLLYTYKKIQPRNYLYCDGSTFNAGQYPALYLYLGSNVLPDYRECSMVGAEENTTDQIETHDVYAQGEFKDDQIQNITGSIVSNGYSMGSNSRSVTTDTGALGSGTYTKKTCSGDSSGSNYMAEINFDASRSVRAGTTTHGKRKAVYVYIKAVDGVDISDEDTFLNTVKDYVDNKLATAESYSTTEQLTGGTWIDGKPIYRKVFSNFTAFGGSSGAWNDSGLRLSGVGTLIKGTALRSGGSDVVNSMSFEVVPSTGIVKYYSVSTGFSGVDTVILEYTKTTD